MLSPLAPSELLAISHLPQAAALPCLLPHPPGFAGSNQLLAGYRHTNLTPGDQSPAASLPELLSSTAKSPPLGIQDL